MTSPCPLPYNTAHKFTKGDDKISSLEETTMKEWLKPENAESEVGKLTGSYGHLYS
jgi:hypothetical protein